MPVEEEGEEREDDEGDAGGGPEGAGAGGSLCFTRVTHFNKDRNKGIKAREQAGSQRDPSLRGSGSDVFFTPTETGPLKCPLWGILDPRRNPGGFHPLQTPFNEWLTRILWLPEPAFARIRSPVL